MSKTPETKPSTFEDDIRRITDEVLREKSTEDIIKENIQKSIEAAVKNSFSYGDLSRIVEKRIRETLVPYIENYDFKEYIPKLDAVLSDIVNTTTIKANRDILNNFKYLMLEPENDVVPLSDIFKRWCKYVAANVDTDELDVDIMSGPSYETVECYMRTENSTIDGSLYERIDVVFSADHALEYNDENVYVITLTRFTESKDKNYSILYQGMTPDIPSLRNMNEFEVFLLNLARNVKISPESIEDMSEDVEPDAEPEPTYK